MLKVAAVLPLVAILAMTGQAHAADAAKGKKVFRKCRACHQVGDEAKNRVGPILNGIVDRAAATIEGFKYSDAMINSGVTWTEESLDAFLTKPKEFVSGTKMSFPGLRKEEDRADVIAFLKEFE